MSRTPPLTLMLHKHACACWDSLCQRHRQPTTTRRVSIAVDSIDMSAKGGTKTLSRRSSKPPPAGGVARDPMIILQNILSSQNMDLIPKESVTFKSEGGSLEQLASQRFSSKSSEDHVGDIKQEIENLNQLHSEIQKSDEHLEKMQNYLNKFKVDLDELSNDMEQLQTKSVQLTKRLDKRTQVEAKLAPLVEKIVVPPHMAKRIVESEITPQWRDALDVVRNTKKELDKMSDEGQDGKAIAEAREHTEMLTYKAVERVRDFIVMRIKSLRVAGVNSQSIQKILLEYKDLFAFLKSENEPLADDLRHAYVNTMNWYYAGRFSRYIKSLEKLPLHTFDKSMLLGDDTGTRRGLFYRGGQSNAATAVTDMSIGARSHIIESDDPSVMLAQVAETATGFNYMETGYRSLNLALVDNACVEYQFLTDFFQLSSEMTAALFQQIFAQTFTECHTFTKTLIQDSYDCYGILINIRLAKRLEFEAQHRNVPILEDYLNLEMINLWPRFQSVMDSHCEGLRRAATRSSSFTLAQSGTSESTSVPHQITQQFASLLSGILSICPNDEAASEPVANSIQRLRNDFESFLTKVSSAISNEASRERFLHHNYALISTILSDIPGILAKQQQEHFTLLTDAYLKNA